MYIIDVIPLVMIPRSQSQILSYFYDKPLEKGAVVEIDFNRRKINGVVVGWDTLKNRKLDFKKNVSFELKNITKVINSPPHSSHECGGKPLVSVLQLEIARWLSNYYYSPLGVALKTVLPPFWLKKSYNYEIPPFYPYYDRNNGRMEKREIKYIQTNLDNHAEDYREIIENFIKNGKQVFLMVPENTSAVYFADKLSSLDPEIISGSLSNKKFYDVWQKTNDGKARLIIGTRVGLFLPFKNLGLIIVDDESNDAYKSDMTPKYHAADLAEMIAGLHDSDLIISAIAPRVETFQTYKPNQTLPKNYAKIIDVVDEIKAANFFIFSRDLQDILKEFSTKSYQPSTNNHKLILYIPRRGHANFVFCEHCGKSIKCPNCNVNLILHVSPQKTELKCHHCNFIGLRPKNCPSCEAYKLKNYGIGIEKVRDELLKFFKYRSLEPPEILLLDSESAETKEKGDAIVSEFMETKKPIVLLATQMIFSYKYKIASELNSDLKKKPIIGIITADTLINIPDFRTQESLFRQISVLGQMASELIIQTHNPENFAITLAAGGNYQNFYKTEIENRSEFSYPPFSNFIKLTFRDRDSFRAKKEVFGLYDLLKRLITVGKSQVEILGPSPAFIARERGQYVWNIILKIKKSEELKTRNELLRAVPPGWIIDVDPKNII